MSGDSGERLPDPRRADLSMPNIVEVESRRTRFVRRRLRNFKSEMAENDEAVEIIVRTDRPIPIRNLGPALYVGDTPVTEVEEIGPNTYRFVAPGPARERLRESAVINLGWTGKGPGAETDSAREAAEPDSGREAAEPKVFRFRLEADLPT